MENQQQADVIVVLVPFLAQSHLAQLLNLSRLIASYDIPVHFVSTATHTRQAKLRIHGWDPLAVSNIHFHQFPTPHFESPLPDPLAPTKFPSHLQPCFDASSHLRQPMSLLLRSLSLIARRVIVIHDFLMASVVQDLVSLPNAQSYAYQCLSAFSTISAVLEGLGKPFPTDLEVPNQIISYQSGLTPEMIDFKAAQIALVKSFNSGTLYNTYGVLEGAYFDLLANEQVFGTKNHWPIGPVNPVKIISPINKDSRHICLEWLDEQDPNSVILVAFGTTSTLSEEQIKELAIGLERSDQKFIWVLRDADKGDIFDEKEMRSIVLPKGYEERVMERGMGMVVRDWAPQLEILGHPSTGGFMSHCGWTSCIESISMGVPIVTWPMIPDQKRNAVLVTKLLKFGIVVKDEDKMDELVASEKIEEAVKRLMATKEGEKIRERAVNLGGAVQRSMEEGGDSRMELDSFISHITKS